MIYLEIIFLGIILMFLTCSINQSFILGQVYSLFILSAAAAEAAIGLSLLAFRFRIRTNISFDALALLKG